MADREALDTALGALLAEWSVADADQKASKAGVPASPVLRPSEAVAHPAVTRISVDHPVLGPLEMVGPALQTATTCTVHTAPPPFSAAVYTGAERSASQDFQGPDE